MLHQTLPILGHLWQLFEVSQILEFLRYVSSIIFLRVRFVWTRRHVACNILHGTVCCKTPVMLSFLRQ